MKYRCISSHAEDLDDGRVLEPGDFVDDGDYPGSTRFAQLVEDGLLVDMELPDATDGAIKLSEAEGISLTAVTGTGQNGRITVDDVKAFVEASKGGQE